MEKREIIAIIEKLRNAGLLTRTKTNNLVFERFKNSTNEDEVIKFILSSGEPSKIQQCSECKENLSADQFSYYQARVDNQGYLSRSNALCNECSKKINKERKEILATQQDKIPERPQSGTLCPNCNRAWSGNWHQHHSYETGEFVAWLCGNCNMALQDRRNPGR